MPSIYLKEDDISDINRIEEYNNEYLTVYPNFKPYVTKENFKEFLEEINNKKQGINNNGLKEIYYFAIENDKIVGHASIRLNPETDKSVNIYGHIMYGVVPSKRKQGYGTIICSLLLEKMKEMGYKEVIITCNDDNVGSSKIIEMNGGNLVEIVKNEEDENIKRYSINL